MTLYVPERKVWTKQPQHQTVCTANHYVAINAANSRYSSYDGLLATQNNEIRANKCFTISPAVVKPNTNSFSIIARVIATNALTCGIWRSNMTGTTFCLVQTSGYPWIRSNGVDVLKPTSGPTVLSSTLQTVAFVFSPGRYEFWSDGKLLHSSTNSTAIASNLTFSVAGAQFDYTQYASPSLFVVLDGIAYDFESLTTNPWQLFAPRRQWFAFPPSGQIKVPFSDITTGSWSPSTGSTLYGVIDEASPDASDYISSSTANSTCEVKLSSAYDPQVSSGHVISYELLAGSVNTVLALKQGSTTIASWNHGYIASDQVFIQSLTASQADSITSYSDLRVSVTSVFDWVQRGSVLEASDAADIDSFGSSTALSNNGNILAVGAYNWEGSTGTNRGGVYIYDWSGSAWVQRGSVLEASDAADNDLFGSSVALSSDGSVMVVGARARAGLGGVYIYDWSGSAWVQRGSVLEASDKSNSDLFGASVAVSDNASILVVGAHQWEGATGTNRGGVYIYDWSGSAWVQRGSVLEASDAVDSDLFGYSVALSSDGSVLIVGAPAWEGSTGTNRGGVYIYDWSGSAWVQRGSVLEASDAADNDDFGIAVSLTGDGNTLIIGASAREGSTGTNRGGVYTYDWSGSAWVQRGSVLEAGDAADNDLFGSSVALSSDGSVMVVGARGWEGSTGSTRGGVYAYT